MDLIARKAFSYAGRRLQVGDSFTAKPRDARVLVAIGRADHAGPVIATPEPVAPESVEPEPVAPAEASKPRRQYRRRDLTAES